jgi:hypothetical protein
VNAVVVTPVVNRSVVPVLADYSAYREVLRFDFYYSCAYCSVSEIEATGIGFQIDHYIPQVHGGTNVYTNLMWSCQHCNRGKSHVWLPVAQQAAGFRFVRPDVDNPADHYDLGGYKLFAKTKPGEFSIEVLGLNRQTLQTVRKIRSKMHHAIETVALGLQQFRKMKVDHLKPELRAKYLDARDAALAQVSRLREIEESELIVRVLNHSPMIDPDPTVRDRNKARRDYLKSIGARTDFKFEPTQ